MRPPFYSRVCLRSSTITFRASSYHPKKFKIFKKFWNFSVPTSTWASFTSSSKSSGPANQTYEQIPEHLKLHMFTPELEILRYDELKSPFRDFSSGFILDLLELRANEVRLETGNSNPNSRLTNDNVVRFMKVSSRLKQLFSINGGNTEILDAVLYSQSALNAFEAKLAKKRQEKLEKLAKTKDHEVKDAPDRNKVPTGDIYASGPYVQIPESLGIHEFTHELDLFRQHELKKSYSGASAREIVDLMEKRLKEVYVDAETFTGPGISQKNLVRFYNLFPKLQKLLAWNGGYTPVLDTMLLSQSTFDAVEKKIRGKRQNIMSSNLTYKPIPEDLFLEEYFAELEELRDSKLHKKFSEASSAEILTAVAELAEAHTTAEKRLTFSKLYRNLMLLFTHNNGETFVLDNVLVNRKAFDKFESSLPHPSEDEFQMIPEIRASLSADIPSISESESQKYRGTDHVISLLNDSHATETVRTHMLGDDERSIQSALSQAMNKEEKILHKEDPSEFEEVVSLTPDKIRDGYKQSAYMQSKPVQKDDIEKYLKKVKENKVIADENKWREQTAYEWSNNLYKNHRSFESKNFFSPILGNGKSANFPMFPGIGEEYEYLILSAGGQKFHTSVNPLGVNHVPEDMFAILQTLSEEELAKFSRNIEKLRRKKWRLIGSGKTKGMFVLSRESQKRGLKLGKLFKVILVSSAICFSSLIFVNWVVDDQVVASSSGSGAEHASAPEMGDVDSGSKGSTSTTGHSSENRSLLRSLMWK